MRDSELTLEVQAVVVKLVRRNCIRFRINSESDICQDIYAKLLTPSPSVKTTYLQRFDATKNSIEGFLSRFIFNYFCRVYSRHIHPVESAQSLDKVLPALENHEAFSYTPQIFHDSAKVSKIYEQLASFYPFSSGVLLKKPFSIPPVVVQVVQASHPVQPSDDEELLWRSVANIFRLLFEGFSQEEVAVAMVVSRGWISKKVQLIRNLPEVTQWAGEFGISALSS
ncbi:hypothetical protein KW797_03830 [Candidatus Parcubacteria bacterium]|nr:hypothetical protein [Candidatus Parcubacteria bacterium]